MAYNINVRVIIVLQQTVPIKKCPLIETICLHPVHHVVVFSRPNLNCLTCYRSLKKERKSFNMWPQALFPDHGDINEQWGL